MSLILQLVFNYMLKLYSPLPRASFIVVCFYSVSSSSLLLLTKLCLRYIQQSRESQKSEDSMVKVIQLIWQTAAGKMLLRLARCYILDTLFSIPNKGGIQNSYRLKRRYPLVPILLILFIRLVVMIFEQYLLPQMQ